MTAPSPGKLEDALRRVSEAYKDGRIVSGLKRRAREVLQRMANHLQGRPRLKRATLWTLRLAPPLHRRLSAMMEESYRPRYRNLRRPRDSGPADLSPAARNVFNRLTRQLSTRNLDADRH
jgi:O-antigen chain-terminating methyltransferase